MLTENVRCGQEGMLGRVFVLLGLFAVLASAESTTPRSEDVFVGVVAFRDRRCGVTLSNLFSKAKHPSRVTVGVIEYTHTEDDASNCIKDFCRVAGARVCEQYKANIKRIEVSFLDARGPNMARYMQETLLGDQDFCMQVDAHSDFVQNWDVDAITTWRKLDNEYGVLSTKPPSPSALRATPSSTEIDHLCQAKVTKAGVVRNVAPQREKISSIAASPDKILAPLWSAGFSFSKCHAVKKTPYDPTLMYLFDGEEFAMFARLWTRGYDVYTPSHPIVVHDYGLELYAQLPEREMAVMSNGKKIDPTSWSRQGQSPEYMRQMYDDAHGHVLTMLGRSTSEGGAGSTIGHNELVLLSRYGLGSKRTLEQLIAFTGVDTRASKLVADKCGKRLELVPFARDADPWTEEGDVWGRAPEELVAGGADIPLLDGGSVPLFSS